MFYVYKITNLVNEKVYVGKTNDLARRWTEHTSGARGGDPKQVIAKAIRKYGVASFRFETLQEYHTDEAALLGETSWVLRLNANVSRMGYNLDEGGLGGRSLSIETRLKIAAAHRGKKASAQTRARLSASHKGLKRSAESIEKTASALRGRTRPPEVVERATSARTWTGHSVESKAKMSASLTGRSLTSEHAEKIGAAHRGKKRSPEAVARMTAAQRLRREREAV